MRQECTLFQSKCMPREGFDEGQDARSRIAWLCRSRVSVADVSAGDMNKTSREMLVVEKAGCDGEGGGKGVIGCDGAGICASTKRCGVEEWKELEVEVELQGRWHCEWKELREGTRKCAASASSPATVHSRERRHPLSNVKCSAAAGHTLSTCDSNRNKTSLPCGTHMAMNQHGSGR